jgi:hypothetical protein
LQYPKDLDTAIYYIFRNPIPTVKVPLEDRLFEEIKTFSVDIYFGEQDWMDQIGSVRLCQKDNQRFKMFMVSNSGHNFNLEQSEELAGYLLSNHTLSQDLDQISHLALDTNQEIQFNDAKNAQNQEMIEMKEINVNFDKLVTEENTENQLIIENKEHMHIEKKEI